MLNSSNVQKGIIKSTSNHTKGTIVKSNSTLNSVCSLSMQSFISWNHLSHLSFRSSFFLLSSSLLYPPTLCKYMYVCVCSVIQSCLTLCDPVNNSPPDSSLHGIFQARILEWVCHFILLFLTQGSNWCLLHLLPWQAHSFPPMSSGKHTHIFHTYCLFYLYLYTIPYQ